MRSGTARACGSCGELVQGVLPSGLEFQVTLPIDLYSSARVVATESSQWEAEVRPRCRRKAGQAAIATAQHLGSPPLHLFVTIDSTIPIGAGLGSSTADIVATVRATAVALDADVTRHDIGRIAGSIEFSDGTMHSGMCITDRRGRLVEEFPWTPPLHVVALVPQGRAVSTEDVPLAAQRQHARTFSGLLDDLRAASAQRDAQPFVEVAMASAKLHQAILPNPLLAQAPELRRRTGAAGWNVAHTGTALGLLFHDRAQAIEAASDLERDPTVAGSPVLQASVVEHCERR